MLCAVITGKSENEIQSQIKRSSNEADLLEIRWDCFESFDVQINTSLPQIYTLRPISEGGFYEGSEISRLEKIKSLCQNHPAYLDLEHFVPDSFVEEIKKKFPNIKIIISYHNFKETPIDLQNILSTMKKKGADLYKIATYAHSSLDALRVLSFIQSEGSNLISLAMGEHGLITRIINHWSYASVDEETKVAKGQLSLETLTQHYRFKEINSETEIYALIGNPVEKSVSHITHNKVFKTCGLNAIYLKLEIEKEDLKTFFRIIKDLNFKGLSVTMPLKEAVIPYLDHLDQKAFQISAVNTILIHENQLIGYNTDCQGALSALEEVLDSIQNKNVWMIGAGGSALAIAFELIHKGAFVTLFNRDEKKAKGIAKKLNCEAFSIDEIPQINQKKKVDILINCTPVEMPIKKEDIPTNCYVMDINSTPKWSLLLKEAKEKNCTPIFGYQMFIYQAIGQFELWFKDFSHCCKKDRPSLLELFNLSE